MAIPAHDWRWDLIANCVAQHRWVFGERSNNRAHPLFEGVSGLGIFEESNVLLPGDTHHHTKVVIMSHVEKPAGRDGVRANGVHATSRHLSEIADCLS